MAAALVDGCTTFAALRRVLLAAVRPGLITVGLFAFLASWNDFCVADPAAAPPSPTTCGATGGPATIRVWLPEAAGEEEPP